MTEKITSANAQISGDKLKKLGPDEQVDYKTDKEFIRENIKIQKEIEKLEEENSQLYRRIDELSDKTGYFADDKEHIKDNKRLNEELELLKEENSQLYRRIREFGEKMGYP